MLNIFKFRLFFSLFTGFILLITVSCKKEEDTIQFITVTDIESHVYQTVQIGDQVWMAENLKTTKLKDGTDIAWVEDDSVWFNLSLAETPGFCWYLNDEATYGETYGPLYNWYTVETGKLCPEGWHVPSDAEWILLTTYLGGAQVAGGKLKETGTIQWESPNASATNETGFTALPAGWREPWGYYDYLGLMGSWWSTDWTSNSYNSFGFIRLVSFENGEMIRDGFAKNIGVSVRCLKD
jgi:uncharacterized protein (TIGR02145 family)